MSRHQQRPRRGSNSDLPRPGGQPPCTPHRPKGRGSNALSRAPAKPKLASRSRSCFAATQVSWHLALASLQRAALSLCCHLLGHRSRLIITQRSCANASLFESRTALRSTTIEPPVLRRIYCMTVEHNLCIRPASSMRQLQQHHVFFVISIQH